MEKKRGLPVLGVETKSVPLPPGWIPPAGGFPLLLGGSVVCGLSACVLPAPPFAWKPVWMRFQCSEQPGCPPVLLDRLRIPRTAAAPAGGVSAPAASYPGSSADAEPAGVSGASVPWEWGFES